MTHYEAGVHELESALCGNLGQPGSSSHAASGGATSGQTSYSASISFDNAHLLTKITLGLASEACMPHAETPAIGGRTFAGQGCQLLQQHAGRMPARASQGSYTL